MSFWQAARREASGALRSIRYDFIQVLLGQRGSRRVLAVTGLTALVAAGGLGTAFAVAGSAEPVRQADHHSVRTHSNPPDAGGGLIEATGTPAPSPSKSPKHSPSASASPRSDDQDDTTGRTPSPNPRPTHSHKPPEHGHPSPTPTHHSPTASPSPSPSPTDPTSPPPDDGPGSASASSTPASSPSPVVGQPSGRRV
ncbi:MAG: hypothetical protein WCA46_18695 [Actinocatenispora sp.]